MTELKLNVEHDIVLPPALSSQIYNTNTVMNHIELQTLEKGFQKVPATSKDNNSLTFNLPSISGGSMYRELEFEIPLEWSITYEPIVPVGYALKDSVGVGPATWGAGVELISGTLGSSVRPFLSQLNCLDQFPLSKILRNRTYRFNNSSVSLREDLSPEQIDLLVAQMNLNKMANDGLEVFADANSHFDTLDLSTGGILLPDLIVANASTAPTTIVGTRASNQGFNLYRYRGADASEIVITGGIGDICSKIFDTLRLDEKCVSWMEKRNTARNIFNQSVTYENLANGATGGKAQGYGSNTVPQKTMENGYSLNVAYYKTGSTTTVYFKATLRECCISQYFDHPYNFNEFSWNMLIPLSTLDMRFSFDTKYLEESVLKIGDSPQHFTSYSVTIPKIGNQNECFFILKQCKVPLPLQTRDAYKVLFYDQIKPQTAKDATVENNVISAEMQYANLSQIGEYLYIYMPINKSEFLKNNVDSYVAGKSRVYQLPSIFNLPITKTAITVNSDTGLATYDMDMFRLQQLTLKNLQDDEKLRNVIVGESCPISSKKTASFSGVNGAAALTTNAQFETGIIGNLAQRFPTNKYQKMGNGISNSSFFILKMGTDIRLPDSYCPSQIVNYNLTVKAVCDLNSPYLRPYGDQYNDVKSMIESAGNSKVKAQLEVVHLVKKIYTLSGTANQSLYVHDVMVTGENYYNLRNKYESTFDTEVRDDMPFSSDAMIGGSFLSNLRDKASKALSWLTPKIKSALKTGRQVVNFAKENVDQDNALNKYIEMADKGLKITGNGNAMNPHVISAGAKKKGKPSGSSKGEVNWRQYL